MIEIALNAAGGLALFLLAMGMMTEGLKVFGGRGLRLLLERWTSTSVRAALSGTLVTAIVQSSSAVTVAIIGFVNAGILELPQALGVVFGANVGTTFTGWLVSITGFGFRIETFALPIIAIGVAIRFLAPERRFKALGEAIAGFGMFFLGLAILKDAFSGVAENFGRLTLAENGPLGVLLFLLGGFVATLLTQSSSAAVALILTAAGQSAVGLDAAAAAIIGANIGTTSTALFASIGATPNARRVAAGHIFFNVCTAGVALLILPLMIRGIDTFDEALGVRNHPQITLAMFHTVFNLLGIALMLPFVSPLSRRLNRFFVTAEEDFSRPRFLDRTVAATPSLALPALHKELARMRDLVRSTAVSAVEGRARHPLEVERQSGAVALLGHSVAEFATQVRMEHLERELAEHLPRLLRIARYLEESAQLIPQAAVLRRDLPRLQNDAAEKAVQSLLDGAKRFLSVIDDPILELPEGMEGAEKALFEFEAIYQSAKAELLRMTVEGHVSVEDADRRLDALSRTRRLIEQLAKATRMLRDEKFLVQEGDLPGST